VRRRLAGCAEPLTKQITRHATQCEDDRGAPALAQAPAVMLHRVLGVGDRVNRLRCLADTRRGSRSCSASLALPVLLCTGTCVKSGLRQYSSSRPIEHPIHCCDSNNHQNRSNYICRFCCRRHHRNPRLHSASLGSMACRWETRCRGHTSSCTSSLPVHVHSLLL